ncbi:hypothetical protein [Hymenobacter daeguensis]
MELPPSFSPTPEELPELAPPRLADFRVVDDFAPTDDDESGFVAYDISEVILTEHVMSLVVEFLEQYPTWERREVRFSTCRRNIPLVEEALIEVQLPEGGWAELQGIPLYQFQVKANSEDVWRVFKAVMKGEGTPLSWQRTLADFEGLSEKATYHVRRLESPEVKQQVVADFIAQYKAAGVKQVSIKPDGRGFYPWFMLYSRRPDGSSVKLCVVIDNETEQQNKAQFFALVKLYSSL